VHNPTAYRLTGGRATEERIDDPGVEVVTAPAGRVGTTATYLTGMPLGYGRQLDRLVSGFDVVHFHNPSLLGGPGGFGIGDGLRLYTTWEHWLMCPTHVLFRYGREVCTERTCVRCTLSYRRPPQLWRATGLLDRAVAELDMLLCPSRFTAELHRTEFPSTPIEVLPFPAPERDPTATPPALPDTSKPFFLYAGRLEPIKGVRQLVDAFARVRGADLLVAGDGKQDKMLRERAAGSPRVRFLGRLPREAVIELARAALAVVVPSVGYETFGGVAVEAMSVGTPAVVRDLGPLPELVEDGGGVTFSDDDDLVQVLQAFVDDPELARRHGEKAVEVCRVRFDPNRFFTRYLGIVKRLAAEKGRHDLAHRISIPGDDGG
jgi:glycosyltransferase involved in cell wall biosynthesis